MSSLNLTFRLRHFNINIHIKKDMSKENSKLASILRHEMLIKEWEAKRDAEQIRYHYLSGRL